MMPAPPLLGAPTRLRVTVRPVFYYQVIYLILGDATPPARIQKAKRDHTKFQETHQADDGTSQMESYPTGKRKHTNERKKLPTAGNADHSFEFGPSFLRLTFPSSFPRST